MSQSAALTGLTMRNPRRDGPGVPDPSLRARPARAADTDATGNEGPVGRPVALGSGPCALAPPLGSDAAG